MVLWRCEVCGYVHEGENAPEKCPKCGALKENFEKIDDEKSDLIRKSRITNDAHMALIGIMREAQELATVIKNENLDPNCVAVADRIISNVEEITQSIKAELEGHMKKGKWG